MSTSFSPSVVENLGYYVYLLADPDTNEIFYVGKGIGNRIFEHLHEANYSASSHQKLDIIRTIQARGKAVACLIHRHGLDEKQAYEVEASLIDFIGLHRLSNRMGGHNSDERGHMNVAEAIARYDAPEVDITDSVILIIVNTLYYRGIGEQELYEKTRKSWKIAPNRRNPKYAFAVFRGVVRQVYEIEQWYQPPDHAPRWAFNGKIATNIQHYVGKSVAKYIKPGARNPTKYVNC